MEPGTGADSSEAPSELREDVRLFAQSGSGLKVVKTSLVGQVSVDETSALAAGGKLNSFVREFSESGESGKDSGDLILRLFKLPTILEDEGISK